MSDALRGIVVFEDAHAGDLAPLTGTLPVPALIFGAGTLASRWADATGAGLVSVEARAAALACWRDAPACAPVENDGLLLAANAACLPVPAVCAAPQRPMRWTCGGRTVAALAPAARMREGLGRGAGFAAFVAALDLPVSVIEARVIDRPWRLIEWNLDALSVDLAAGPFAIEGDVHPRAVIDAAERVSIARGARIDALAYVDAREGPVRIGADARVAPHTWVKGPCAIGARTELLGGLVGRSSIGPDCRIAGEVEDCLFQGRANKRHHGFVGHSIVGEWVNLGALTTTSDLKNNYGSVRMHTPDGEIDTGSRKVGALIGAHVKTGIGTLLPTGAWIGAGANLFGGGRFAPKHVPPFAWWDGTRMNEHRFDAFLSTARIAASRRGVAIGDAEARALEDLFESTAAARAAHA